MTKTFKVAACQFPVSSNMRRNKRYILHHTKGSHKRFMSGNQGITIPFHKEFKPKTAKSIIDCICSQQDIETKTFMSTYKIKL